MLVWRVPGRQTTVTTTPPAPSGPRTSGVDDALLAEALVLAALGGRRRPAESPGDEARALTELADAVLAPPLADAVRAVLTRLGPPGPTRREGLARLATELRGRGRSSTAAAPWPLPPSALRPGWSPSPALRAAVASASETTGPTRSGRWAE
jgi:hypothetical protein